MTKKLLKNIILRIRSLTGLPEPDRITYYWNDDGLVEFKLFFDSLIIPKDFIPKGFEGVDSFQQSFSKIPYNENYLTDFLIKDINLKEGFITILTDDQDFKKISSNREAEDLGESILLKDVVLANKKVSNKLVENFGVIEKESRLFEDEESDNLDAMNAELEASQESEVISSEIEPEKKDEEDPQYDLLVVNIPLAAWVSSEDLSGLMTLLYESAPKLLEGEDGLIIKITSSTTTGVSQAQNLLNIKKAAELVDPESAKQVYIEQSDILQSEISRYKNKKVYTTKLPSNFNTEEVLKDLLNQTQYTGSPEKLDIINKINTELLSIYEKSLNNLDIKIGYLKQNTLPAFKAFVKDFISSYKTEAKAVDLEDGENEEAENEEA